MSLEIVYNRLINQGITEPVYYEQPEDGKQRPYIVLMQDNSNPTNTKSGVSTLDINQVRVLVFGDRYLTGSGITGAKSLANTCRTALDFFEGVGSFIKYENENSESAGRANERAFMIEQTYTVHETR